MFTYWTTQTFDKSKVSEIIQLAYSELLPYVTLFLCAQHPYRGGKVCPFVPKALENEAIFFVPAIPNETNYTYRDLIIHCLTFYKE